MNNLLPLMEGKNRYAEMVSFAAYLSYKDEVSMRINFDKVGHYTLWDGQINVSFPGNQTMQICLEVDCKSEFTENPVEVEGLPLIPVWLAWVVALKLPVFIVLIWKNISNEIPQRVE